MNTEAIWKEGQDTSSCFITTSYSVQTHWPFSAVLSPLFSRMYSIFLFLYLEKQNATVNLFVYFATTTDSSWWYNWGKQESIEHKSLSGQ